jgi:hypothetical protein
LCRRANLAARIKRLRQFAELSPPERGLLLCASLLVAGAQLALWMMPLRWVRFVLRVSPAVSPNLGAIRVKRLAWAVQAAALRIPGATCLTQALALQHHLAWRGETTKLHIGVAKDIARGFEAHAWLEHRGAILVGDNGELERYTPILA